MPPAALAALAARTTPIPALGGGRWLPRAPEDLAAGRETAGLQGSLGTRRQVTGCFSAGAPERDPVPDSEGPGDKTTASQASMGGAAGAGGSLAPRQ